ncbi:hypothetical protein ACQCVP_16855 [Rossellomorea vietnamensis]|uniref:hypothetical protein n=1 Tax=Rossellomorea vietnamensis TaxID=218284 RepID=UPI003CE97B8F
MTAYLDFFLLFLSLGGLGAAIYYKLKIHSAFIPIFLFAGITFILFIAGILNMLPLAADIIYYGGLLVWPVILYYWIRRKLKLDIKGILTPATIFFVLGTVLFMFLVEGVYFTHYDNFSHWALIVKEMYLMDGLPDDSTVVLFRNYPPGAALFIYFILESTGYAESYALMAQGFLMTASLTVLFAWSSWKKPIYIILSLLLVLSLVSLEMYGMYNLIVDKTLGMVAFTSVFIACYYYNDWKKNLIVNIPVLVLLILIKDSGKLFFVFNSLLIMGLIFRNRLDGGRLSFKSLKLLIKPASLLLGIPVFINYLWLKYTDKAYTASYGQNKYAVTKDKVTSPNKSDEFIQSLFPNMMERLINIDTHIFLIFLMTNGALIITFLVMWGLHKRASKLLIYSFLYCNISFAVYIGSLYLMYLFLMPEGEAARLASYFRYLTTIIIYIGAIGMGAALLEWSKEPKTSGRILLGVALALTMYFPIYEKDISIASKPDINDSIRAKVKPAVKKILDKDKNDPRILYYSPESKGDGGYLSFISLFEQLSNNYKVISTCEKPEEAELFNEEMQNAEFLVVLANDNSQCLSPFAEIDESEGIYRINTQNKEIQLENIE